MPAIHVTRFLILRFSFVIAATIISNNENAEVSVANKNNNKKMSKNPAPKGILSNTAGKTTNSKPGPSSGSKPKAKTAGNMASPASNEINKFIMTIVDADFDKSFCFDKYELYVTMTDTPTLIEKKDCQSAYRTVSDVNLEKSGYKKKVSPSVISFRVRERMIKMIKAINSAGIMILLAFSMPFCIPFATTTIVITINKSCDPMANPGFAIASSKNKPYSPSGRPDKFPTTVSPIYNRIHPPTTL